MNFLHRLRGRRPAAPSAPSDPAARYEGALLAARAQKDEEFRSSPQSPLPDEARASFAGLAYYPPRPDLRFTVPLQREEETLLLAPTSDGEERAFRRLGTIRVGIEGEEVTLAVYESEGGDLFLPFRDGTSGSESYGAGRYLEPIALAGDELLVDFNLAYNPYCAYAADFSCPLPPRENWLTVPIRAGERYPHRQEGD